MEDSKYVILVYGDMHAVYIKREDIDKYSTKELDQLMKEQILDVMECKSQVSKPVQIMGTLELAEAFEKAAKEYIGDLGID